VLLLDRANQDIKRIPRYGQVVAAVSIEIETVQRLNDTAGHEAADELLVEVSDRLNDLVRQSDTVGIMSSPNSSTLARIGSNEFVILLADLASHEAVNHIVRRAVDALEGPMSVDEERIYINANVGIGLYPHDASSSEELIKNAGAARAQAKRHGRRVNIAYYSDEANEASDKQVRIEKALHQALRHEQFSVLYQPKIRLDTGRYCGMEALIRWRSPELGDVSPSEFIPIAEEIGLMPEISSWVLTQICTQLKKWKPLGLENFRVAVNLSPVELRDPEVATRFLSTLQKQGVSPALLEVEITESAVIDNMSTAVKSLQTLKDAGVELAIDDFGTGYSSLSHLTSLPLHVLKIDGCFVRDLDVNANNQGIVNAILAMGQTAGLRILAEGVENKAELDWLCRAGCDEIQGFLISRPVNAATVTSQLIENLEQATPLYANETAGFWQRLLRRGAA
jgi:diguanylate cyclase (GGDEF)-like protein